MTIRRPAILTASLLVIGLLAGCVQFHSETTIDKNGGGTAVITMSMSKAVSDAVKQMQSMDPQGSPGGEMPSFEDIDRAELEKRVKEFGVKVTKFEKGEVDGRETMSIAYEFKDMKGLSAAMGAVMSGGDSDQNGLGIFDAGDGNLVLRSASYDLPDWSADEEADAETESPSANPEDMGKQMELMGTLMGALSELDVTMKITVPGDIVSTSAPQHEGRTSIWTINSSNMMTAGQDMEPEIVFSGKGLNIKPQTE
ncbi:MAG: hypothetical protein R3D98_01570 [Candidatus Krumholzibacteriia bacterium]